MPVPDATMVDVPVANRAGGTDGRILGIAIGILGLAYVILFFSGTRFFVMKTAVLPIVLVYGLLHRERVAFAIHWTPLLSGIILFDALRGAVWYVIEAGYLTYYVGYVIDLERLIFRTPAAPIPLQMFRTHAADLVAVLLHASHFAFFIMFAIVLWQKRREHFGVFARSLGLVMLIGILCYAIIPTAPPWIASQPMFNLLPPIPHIVEDVYTVLMPDLFNAFATNPVAAMPSLHTAFPVLCALVAGQAYGRWGGIAVSVYACAVMVAVMYLGEHYAVDVLAGALVAAIAYVLGRRVEAPALTLRGALMLGGCALLATALIVTTTH